MIRENGKVVTCPVCGSDKVIRVHPFDYWKMCMNNKCKSRLQHPKKLRHNFMTGVHN